jgi:predicted nucleic acid-binding protein
MHRPLANPRAVFEKHIRGRAVLYLDTNAWSDLSEAKTPDAVAARQQLADAHARDVLVCPVAFCTITELLKRQPNADSVAQAQLMDSFSNGVSYRATRYIRDLVHANFY